MKTGAPPGAPALALLETALWTASCRADESTRAHPVLIDPFAAQLCGEDGLSVGRALERKGRAHAAIVVRTRVIDERVGVALVADGIRHVALLGSGLDARPLRLRQPEGVHWLEIDFPESIAWKRDRLPHLAEHHELLALDLKQTELLAKALDRFSGGGPILVVLEGVVPYLAREEADALFAMLAARRTTVVCDVSGGLWGTAIARRTADVVAGRGVPFRTRIADPAGWLESLGFRVTANVSLVDWDAARSDRRWDVPWTARLLPGYRDAARVLEGVIRGPKG